MKIEGKATFYCPHCNQKLSFQNGRQVKMVGRLHAEHFSCKTMFYIPATLGHYGAIIEEGIRIRDGAEVDFECINGGCKQSFTASYDTSLAEIKMVDESGSQFVVVFSRTFGRRSTLLVDLRESSVVGSYGEHVSELDFDFSKRTNFFGS